MQWVLMAIVEVPPWGWFWNHHGPSSSSPILLKAEVVVEEGVQTCIVRESLGYLKTKITRSKESETIRPYLMRMARGKPLLKISCGRDLRGETNINRSIQIIHWLTRLLFLILCDGYFAVIDFFNIGPLFGANALVSVQSSLACKTRPQDQ